MDLVIILCGLLGVCLMVITVQFISMVDLYICTVGLFLTLSAALWVGRYLA